MTFVTSKGQPSMAKLEKKVASTPLEREQFRDDVLACRTYQHGWEEVIADDLEAPGDGWRLSLTCFRCLTRRHDIIAFHTGELVRRTYDYPDGYDIGVTVTRSEMRVEYARRHNYEFIQSKRQRRKAS